ncbi:hypothetical protein GCM10009533_66130 [Saccharopolyspora spinosporotrichia]|uniref:Uncharacterized protein n=1 Tax=Saccharopolyspora erythraea TaxID=1836 RepID=A0ABN1E5V9_SACER
MPEGRPQVDVELLLVEVRGTGDDWHGDSLSFGYAPGRSVGGGAASYEKSPHPGTPDRWCVPPRARSRPPHPEWD